MPRGRSYRHYKQMRQKLRAENECHSLLQRRLALHKERINRAVILNHPPMVDVLRRKAVQKYEEELDKLEYEVASFEMRKIAREGKLSDIYRRHRDEIKDEEAKEAAYLALRGKR